MHILDGGEEPQKAKKVNQLSNLLIILLLLGSCNYSDRKNDNNVREMVTVIAKDSLNRLLDHAIEKNDTLSYNRVSSYCIINNLGDELFFYALIMANKNNSSEASFHVYDIIARSTPKEPKAALNLMDKQTKNIALYYLLKSYEAGYESAKYQVIDIFGENNEIPKSSTYKCW